MKSLAALLGAALAIFSAQAAGEGKPPTIRTIAKGAFSQIREQTQLVVTNQTQWEELWGKKIRKRQEEPAPKIDFSTETILLAALGSKSTGGYSVTIASIEEKHGESIVTIKTQAPGPDTIAIQAFTAPFHVVAIPATTNRIRFEHHAVSGKGK